MLFRRSCLRFVVGRNQSSRGPTSRGFEGLGLARWRGVRGILTKSLCVGASDPPLIEKTIPEFFRGVVGEHGDRLAVISRHQQAKLTYTELDQQSDALAIGLEGMGVKKGDRVAVMLGNGIEYCVATYALFKLGAILVPLNPAFNALQITSALTHLSTTHLIISSETNLPHKPPKSNLPLFAHLIPDLQAKKVESSTVPTLKEVIVVENSSGRVKLDRFGALKWWEDVVGGGKGRLGARKLDAGEVVNIQFTSGTTSMPKAACLTHRGILNNGKSIGDGMLLTPDDIVCCPPPLFHCFGSVLGYLATTTHASTFLLPSESFNPHSTLLSVQENLATALYGVPTMFISMLDLLSSGVIPPHSLSQLRTGIAAGSSIPSELMRRLHAVLGLPELVICYGMTETSPVSIMTRTDDPTWAKVETVGKVMPHVGAKVVDVTSGDTLPCGVRGELAVSGYLVMKGYWNDEVKTDEAIRKDGEGREWMFTGDEASMDEDGYVRITGRIKDLIIRGGENIHPLEIENGVLGLEFVGDVSVVGLPCSKYGEVVAAFIIRKKGGGEDEGEEKLAKKIREHVRETLSPHLVPKYVFWVEGYPKTASGKIQKFKLREMGMEMVEQGLGM